MQVAIITDVHWGARNDSPQFLDFYEKFYSEVFFPAIDEAGIKVVLMLGDTFDRRKYINFGTWDRAKKVFFNELEKRDILVYVLVGNHDTFFKNTNEVNSPELLLQEYDNITVLYGPQTIHLDYGQDDHDICMVPWICEENYQQCMDEIKNTNASICMGHFEIAGFAMHRGMISEGGLEPSLFKKFNTVFSGHYHHKSSSGAIHYLGNPYELTWLDYNDPRGFHLFDVGTSELQFIQNPNVMFHKIVYDDKNYTIKEINDIDLSKYDSTYVKVIVANKTNPYLFDQFMSKLYSKNPLDVTIVEDLMDLTDSVDNDKIDEAEDTITIINTYVDALQNDGIDNNKLKNIMREIYVEAVSLERV